MATAASGARGSAQLRVRGGTSALHRAAGSRGVRARLAPPTPQKRNKLGQLSNEGPQMYLLMRRKGCSGAQFD